MKKLLACYALVDVILSVLFFCFGIVVFGHVTDLIDEREALRFYTRYGWMILLSHYMVIIASLIMKIITVDDLASKNVTKGSMLWLSLIPIFPINTYWGIYVGWKELISKKEVVKQ